MFRRRAGCLVPRLRDACARLPGRHHRAELDKLWRKAAELAGWAKCDARKINLVRRLRAEIAASLKSLAAELPMGSWTPVANRLRQTVLTIDKNKPPNELNPV